jgi:hypothetical protein
MEQHIIFADQMPQGVGLLTELEFLGFLVSPDMPAVIQRPALPLPENSPERPRAPRGRPGKTLGDQLAPWSDPLGSKPAPRVTRNTKKKKQSPATKKLTMEVHIRFWLKAKPLTLTERNALAAQSLAEQPIVDTGTPDREATIYCTVQVGELQGRHFKTSLQTTLGAWDEQQQALRPDSPDASEVNVALATFRESLLSVADELRNGKGQLLAPANIFNHYFALPLGKRPVKGELLPANA